MAHNDRRGPDDQRALIECLNLIELLLQFIVTHRELWIREEFIRYFEGDAVREVTHRFDIARKQIETDEVDWAYLEGVGLTRSNLAWKHDIMHEAATHGMVDRVLQLANSFLGSLSGGLPVVEFIKEFKEFVEACMKFNRFWSREPSD